MKPLFAIQSDNMFFQPNENVTAFYKNKLSQLEYQHLDQIPPVTPGGMDSPGVDFKLPRDEDKVKNARKSTR